MSLQEGIIFVLCVGNGVRFCGEKVLCLDAHIDLRSNNHCLVTSGVELPHGLPHAEPVAVLHGDHQHLPSLSPSPNAQTEQESSQHLPPKLQSQGHLHTNQKVLRRWWGCATYICSLFFILSSSHLSKMACHWKAACPPNINHYRIRLCLCFITSDFTQGKITPRYFGKSPLTLLLSLGNILVHSLVLHPRPKARLCLPYSLNHLLPLC